MKRILLLTLFLVLEVSHAQSVNARYPWRLPDWLWDATATSHLISAENAITLRADIQKLNSLNDLEISIGRDPLKEEIAGRVALNFSLRDLALISYVVRDQPTNISIAVNIDPALSSDVQSMLHKAVERFLSVALNKELIETALARSSTTPSPMPAVYEQKDGNNALDAAGRLKYTEEFSFYLSSLVKPQSADQFISHLSDVLASRGGSTPVLVISSYSGNIWWGGAYYGFYSDPVQQLMREAPGSGYLYIKLNSEKLSSTALGWDDPNFWASKIAHEILHNLNYWHPSYSSVEERDANNKGQNWSFLYSYERAIFDKLNNKK
jgi:hypothetical protein